MTDGEHFIQLIYSGPQLVDCDYVRDKTSIEEFLTKFNDKVQVLETLVDQAPWISNEKVANVTVKDLDEPTEDVQYLLTPFRQLKHQCRRMQRNKMHMMKGNNFNSTETELNRKRRSLKVGVPGTRWCGRGNVARDYMSLGGDSVLDQCCREHDTRCPYYINSWESQYGVFNWNLYTMNHCTCDERFYTCLRMTNTDASNMVGNIFFNIIKTKCFTLKKENVCSKRSWWGKCLRYQYKKQGTVRDPIPYPS